LTLISNEDGAVISNEDGPVPLLVKRLYTYISQLGGKPGGTNLTTPKKEYICRLRYG
jgi:hypothetical protein